MEKIILIGQSSDKLKSAIESCKGVEVLFLQSASSNKAPAQEVSLGQRVLNLTSNCKGAVLLIPAEDATMLNNVIDNASRENTTTFITKTKSFSDITASPSAFMKALMNNTAPLSSCAVLISHKTLKDSDVASADTFEQIVEQVLINSWNNNTSFNIATVMDQSSAEQAPLSDNMRAKMLRNLVAQVNIEALFPEYNWKEQSIDCATSAYQTLSACFIKLNDMNTADECLTLAEQLQDSPRSLALKGIIAGKRGEMLEAVANLVSSLQEYEQIKNDKEKAKKTLAESIDFEVVNNNLQLGLDALNKRENDKAFNCFKEAVFCFDSFYKKYGITNIVN